MLSSQFFENDPVAKKALLVVIGENNPRPYAMSIELEPLRIAGSGDRTERDTEIEIESVDLPSIVPKELENSEYVPAGEACVGWCNFLSEHHEVEVKKICFGMSRGDSIESEYHLVFNLPTAPPQSLPVTLRVDTEIRRGEKQKNLAPEKTVAGIGVLRQTGNDFWEANASCGLKVKLEIETSLSDFEAAASLIERIVVDETLSISDIREGIGSRISSLKDKLGTDVKDIAVEQFVPANLYFYWGDDGELELIVALEHPTAPGGWSVEYSGTTLQDINWS